MKPWPKEIQRLIFWISAAVIVGFIVGKPLLVLLITITLYLGWHLANIYQLEKWLYLPSQPQPPQGRGIWREIFDRIYHLQKQNRNRKKRLAYFLSRFKESTSAMPDATIVLNQHNQIEWINKAAQTLFGLKPSQDIGQHITNLIRNPEFVAYLKKRDFKEALETHPQKNDQISISIRIIPYGNNQRLLIARDITRLRHLEQIRSDFVSNISHELRTPLTVLRGYLETLKSDATDQPRHWQRSIETMNQQALRMQNIVDDLLMLSRLETNAPQGRHEPVAYPDLLETIRAAAAALGHEKQQTITLEADDQLWLLGNSNEIYSAFSNLVFNAIHYTPAQGDITIRWYRDETGAHLQVKDTGIGIPPQYISRITERFYRVDVGRSRETGGTGLGLAIVKHVLQNHDGQLRVFSQVNRGSVFTCDFPLSLIEQPRLPAKAI